MGVGESPRGTFRFKKLYGSLWKGETLRFADYTLALGAYALQSNGQMTNSEQLNAAMLSDGVYQSAARDISCCDACEGPYCGVLIHETGDTIPVNYY